MACHTPACQRFAEPVSTALARERALRASVRPLAAGWLGDVDSNHDYRSQSPMSYP